MRAEQSKSSSITVEGDFNRSVTFTPTPECLDWLDLAARISQQGSDPFHYRFVPLFLALGYTKHPISSWFRHYLLQSGVDLPAITRVANVAGGDEVMQKLAGLELDPNSLYPGGSRNATASALGWIERGKAYSEEQRQAAVGLGHFVGALLFDPKFHEEDLSRWGFNRMHCASEFLHFVAEHFTDEVSFWKSILSRQYPEPNQEPMKNASVQEVSSSLGGGIPKVYVSYNIREWAVVEPIVAELKHRGITLWVDKWELNSGDNWAQLIQNAKKTSPLWLVFLGPGGPGRAHGKEIEEAMVKATASPPDLAVIPILLPGCAGELPALFQQLMRVEFRAATDPEALDSLYKSIQKIFARLELQRTSEKAQTPPHPQVDELVAEPQRLATFCARLAFQNRAALPLVESPDSVALADALRTSGVATQEALAARLQELEANPETQGLKPSALWLAWFMVARREKLDQIGKDMLALPRADAKGEGLAKPTSAPAGQGKPGPSKRRERPSPSRRQEPPEMNAAPA